MTTSLNQTINYLLSNESKLNKTKFLSSFYIKESLSVKFNTYIKEKGEIYSENAKIKLAEFLLSLFKKEKNIILLNSFSLRTKAKNIFGEKENNLFKVTLKDGQKNVCGKIYSKNNEVLLGEFKISRADLFKALYVLNKK